MLLVIQFSFSEQFQRFNTYIGYWFRNYLLKQTHNKLFYTTKLVKVNLIKKQKLLI